MNTDLLGNLCADGYKQAGQWKIRTTLFIHEKSEFILRFSSAIKPLHSSFFGA